MHDALFRKPHLISFSARVFVVKYSCSMAVPASLASQSVFLGQPEHSLSHRNS